MNIVKDSLVYESVTQITDIGGDFTELSLWAFFREDGSLKTKCLFKNEVINADGIYQGSLNSGRWSATTEFTTEEDIDSSPIILMSDECVDFVLWARIGELYRAPSTLDGIVSVQIPMRSEISASATVVFANNGGRFSNSSSELLPFFENEKMAEIWAGYDGDYVKMFTGQTDITKAYRDPDSATFTVELRNKYADLIVLTMSKRYGASYPQSPFTTMVSGFIPTGSIPAGETYEVKIDAPAPSRWYPGTPKLESITYSSSLAVVGPYGSSETFCFLRITNTSSSAIVPSINITAVDCSHLAKGLYSGSLKIEEDKSSNDGIFKFGSGVNAEPKSYQVYVTGISGGGVSTVSEYKSKYHPQHLIFDPAANATGIQIIFYDDDGDLKTASSDITIYFTIMGRTSDFGKYPSAREVLFDLSKIASRKELQLGDSSELDEDDLKLDAGEYSKHIFYTIEEEFDPNTVRLVNTGEDPYVDLAVLDAGYIEDDDGDEKWGIRIAATRAITSLTEVEFSFQIWGQYPERTDFYMPFYLDVLDTVVTEFENELIVTDGTIEDTVNKVLQVCFDDEDAQHKIYFGADGHGVIKAYSTGDSVSIIKPRNMQEITKIEESPNIIDRIEITGKISQAYYSTTSNEIIHETPDSVELPQGTKKVSVTVEFDKTYDKNSLYVVATYRNDCKVYISTYSYSYCVVTVKKTSKNYHSGRARFQVWGKPMTSVTYQQDFTYKTTPGTSGKYTHVEAEVDNELIVSQALAAKVANAEVLGSANEQLYYEIEGIPANPALEPLDTVFINFEELGAYSKAIVDEVNFTLDGTGDDGPEWTMDITATPFNKFATGSFSGDISVDGDYELDGDYEMDENADVSVWWSLLFGD